MLSSDLKHSYNYAIKYFVFHEKMLDCIVKHGSIRVYYKTCAQDLGVYIINSFVENLKSKLVFSTIKKIMNIVN